MSYFEQKIGDLLAEGKITEGDAKAIREFQAFLADPEVGPGGQITVAAQLRHRRILALSEADVEQITRVEEIVRARGGCF